jgi:hypothetical protein
MSISLATGFHRFVCGVRLFRGLQGKQSESLIGCCRSDQVIPARHRAVRDSVPPARGHSSMWLAVQRSCLSYRRMAARIAASIA